ncbi:MAG: transcriptional repressor [Acidobacteria bacterium]|nr:transcriptional repressor [Acidobacteriota bacterium]
MRLSLNCNRVDMDGAIIFRQYLKRKNLRETVERRTILAEVRSLHKHFTVDDLQFRFRKRRRTVSRATLYRTLIHLVESGLVRKLDLGQREAIFEYQFNHAHHEHMICLKCGKVIEFTNHEMERLQEAACRARRFRAVRHYLQILGYCRGCR